MTLRCVVWLALLVPPFIFGQDVCVTCLDGSKFICSHGQLFCGLEHQNCFVENSTKGCPQAPEEGLSFKEKVLRSLTWSIGHQGARVWNGDELLSGKALLDAVTSPMGPGTNRERVVAFYVQQGKDISHAVAVGVRRCQSEFPEWQMNEHMRFACTKTPAITSKLNISDIDGIRHEFSIAERDDDRVRNRIYCYNNSQVKNLVERNCK
jgi:hypothetical protein